MVIDRLEWESHGNDSPPCPNLYRPWLARVVVASSNIDKDNDFLASKGADVLSAPDNVRTLDISYAGVYCSTDPGSTFLGVAQVAAADYSQTPSIDTPKEFVGHYQNFSKRHRAGLGVGLRAPKLVLVAALTSGRRGTLFSPPWQR